MKLPSDDEAGYAEFEERGAETKVMLLSLLPEETDLVGKRLLDFGCGAGRTLRHFLPEAEDAEIWGVDIDAPSIDWLRGNLCPPLHATCCRPEPPLPFDGEHFDIAWAVSVFTHLGSTSAPWLLELHRVLKPDGLLMASYMGRYNSEDIAGEPWEEDRIGMNVLFHNRPWDDGGPMVLMSDWWVDEHWGRAFEILGRCDFHGQTWTMMRKKDAYLSAEELLAGGGDPRELEALRHNVTQLQREVELTQGVHRSAALTGMESSPGLRAQIKRTLRALRPR